MRRILATSLILSSLSFPAAALASTPLDDASAPTPARISTGVIEPMLLDSATLTIPDSYFSTIIPGDAQVGLTLTIDEKGQPQNIQVVKSLGPFWDSRVVEAVQKFHYKPGSVDNQPTPVDVNLTVNIAR